MLPRLEKLEAYMKDIWSVACVSFMVVTGWEKVHLSFLKFAAIY